jgi:hypothetical protein
MRHVEQRYAADCGVAAAAMACGTSYRRALAAAPARVATRGMGVADMLRLLEELSGRAWAGTPTPRVTLATWAAWPRSSSAVLLVCFPTVTEGRHWLCVSRTGLVYDPSYVAAVPATSRVVRWQRVVREITRC